MRVLLTGATGFLGSHLTRALLGQGHELILLKRSFSQTRRIADLLPHCKTYDLDQVGLEQPFRVHRSIDAIIHAATCYGRKGERARQVLEANTLFPLSLLEMGISYGTPTLFNTDSFFNREPVQHHYLGAYCLSKQQFREWAVQFAQLSRIRFVNVRIEHMYGPDDDESKFVAHVIRKCLHNVHELPLTEGKQERDFIYINDVVTALCLLLGQAPEKPELHQEYELGTGRATSIRSLVDMVHRFAGSETCLRYGALPYRQEEIMHSAANLTALHTLGWTPQYSLEQGIRQTIHWYRDKPDRGEPAPDPL